MIKNFFNKLKNGNVFSGSKNKIAVTSIIIVILLFGFIGSIIGGFFETKENWVVKIGSKYIGIADFERELYRMKQSPKNFNKTEQELKNDLLNIIAIRETFVKESEMYNTIVTDDVISTIIKNDKRFQENGVFSEEKFAKLLQDEHISETQFFENVRNRLINTVVGSFGENFITLDEKESKLIDKSRRQNRNFDIYTLASTNIKLNNAINADELSKFYNSNRQDFKIDNKFVISYIDGQDIARQITYTPSQEEISRIIENNPKLTQSQAIRMARDGYVCQLLNNIVPYIKSKEDLKEIAGNYNLKLKSAKNALFNDISSDKSTYSKGDIAFKITGNRCYDFKISAIDLIIENGYKTFNEAKDQIKNMLISQKQQEGLSNIKKKIEGELKVNKDSFVKISNLLTKYNFKIEKNITSNRENSKLNDKLITQIFTHFPGEFTDILHKNDKLIIAFIKSEINSNYTPSKKELEQLTNGLHASKVSDLYKLYYMHLQDLYSIKINENYFHDRVIK